MGPIFLGLCRPLMRSSALQANSDNKGNSSSHLFLLLGDSIAAEAQVVVSESDLRYHACWKAHGNIERREDGHEQGLHFFVVVVLHSWQEGKGGMLSGWTTRYLRPGSAEICKTEVHRPRIEFFDAREEIPVMRHASLGALVVCGFSSLLPRCMMVFAISLVKRALLSMAIMLCSHRQLLRFSWTASPY